MTRQAGYRALVAATHAQQAAVRSAGQGAASWQDGGCRCCSSAGHACRCSGRSAAVRQRRRKPGGSSCSAALASVLAALHFGVLGGVALLQCRWAVQLPSKGRHSMQRGYAAWSGGSPPATEPRGKETVLCWATERVACSRLGAARAPVGRGRGSRVPRRRAG